MSKQSHIIDFNDFMFKIKNMKFNHIKEKYHFENDLGFSIKYEVHFRVGESIENPLRLNVYLFYKGVISYLHHTKEEELKEVVRFFINTQAHIENLARVNNNAKWDEAFHILKNNKF